MAQSGQVKAESSPLASLHVSKSHKVALVKRKLAQWQQRKHNTEKKPAASQETAKEVSLKIYQSIDRAIKGVHEKQDVLLSTLKRHGEARRDIADLEITDAQSKVQSIRRQLCYKSAEVVLLYEMLQGVANLAHEVELAAPNAQHFFKVRARDARGQVSTESIGPIARVQGNMRRDALASVALDYSNNVVALKAYNVMLRRTITEMAKTGKYRLESSLDVSVQDGSRECTDGYTQTCFLAADDEDLKRPKVAATRRDREPFTKGADLEYRVVQLVRRNKELEATNEKLSVEKARALEKAEAAETPAKLGTGSTPLLSGDTKLDKSSERAVEELRLLVAELEERCQSLEAEKLQHKSQLESQSAMFGLQLAERERDFESRFEQQEEVWSAHFQERLRSGAAYTESRMQMEQLEADMANTIALLSSEMSQLQRENQDLKAKLEISNAKLDGSTPTGALARVSSDFSVANAEAKSPKIGSSETVDHDLEPVHDKVAADDLQQRVEDLNNVRKALRTQDVRVKELEEQLTSAEAALKERDAELFEARQELYLQKKVTNTLETRLAAQVDHATSPSSALYNSQSAQSGNHNFNEAPLTGTEQLQHSQLQMTEQLDGGSGDWGRDGFTSLQRLGKLDEDTAQFIETVWFRETKYLRDQLSVLLTSFARLKRLLLINGDAFNSWTKSEISGGEDRPAIDWQLLTRADSVTAVRENGEAAVKPSIYAQRTEEVLKGFKNILVVIEQIVLCFRWLENREKGSS